MTGAPVPDGRGRGRDGGAHARARTGVCDRPARRAAPVHQSARLRSGGRRGGAARRHAARLQPRRAAGGLRAAAGEGLPRGRRSRSSRPATRSWSRRDPRRSSRFAIRTHGRWRRRWRAPAGSRSCCRWRAIRWNIRARSSAGAWSRICCCFRAESRRASTTWWKQVLAGFGAEFYFDRVLIQPGQPLVFGRARGNVLLRAAGQSRIDHGDVRDFRARGAGAARRARRRRRCICRGRA